MLNGALSPEQRMADAGVRKIPSPRPKARAEERDAPAAIVPLVLADPRAWTGPPPSREWAVMDWVPCRQVTALYGDGGIGKSLLLQMLLTSTAMSMPWLGLETTGGHALGTFCEDDEGELRRRQADINRALGIEPSQLGNLRLLSRVGGDNALMTFDGDVGRLTSFFDQLDAACRQWKPKLLGLDTAADLFDGDEIKRRQVRAFIAGCLGKLARDHDCAVVLAAYPSAEGIRSGSGSGGSTAWNNSVRSRLYLTRATLEDEADPRRVLTRKKSNYAAAGARLEIEWRSGAFVVLDPNRPEDDPATWHVIGQMFDELDRAWKAGRAWSYHPQTKRAGRFFPEWARDHLGVPVKRCVELLSGWLRNGCLTFEVFDRDAKTKGLRVIRRPAE